MTIEMGSTIAILRMFDEARAREFYLDYLGFSVDWQHRFETEAPLYMQLSRADCVLHLSEHHGDTTPGSAVRIYCKQLDDFNDELTARTYKYANPAIQTMPWGSREMTITDPFGNHLIFTDTIS